MIILAALFVQSGAESVSLSEEFKMKRDYLKILQKYDKNLANTACRTRELIEKSGENIGSAESVLDTILYAEIPALILFVEWVLKQAVENGKQRLYFLARDGYLMHHMAERLCRERMLPVECRYLYGSRYAWRVPVYHLDWEGCVDKMCLGGLNVTFLSMMKRGGLDEREACRVAESYWPGLTGKEMDVRLREPVRYAKLGYWKSRFLVDTALRDTIYRKSKAAFQTAAAYLEQEGLTDGTDYAVVDSGWVGSIQQTLNLLLHSMGCRGIGLTGYYYGLYSYPNRTGDMQYHAWYFSPDRGIKNKVFFNNCLFECIFSSPEGSCAGYEYDGSKLSYRPIFDSSQSLNRSHMNATEVIMDYFLEVYAKETGTFRSADRRKSLEQRQFLTACWCSIASRLAKCTGISLNSSKRCSRALWKSFMINPDKEEAQYYGNLQFTDDVTAEGVNRLAAELSDEDLKNKRVLNRMLELLGVRKKNESRFSAWMEGSILLYGKHQKRDLRNEIVHKWLLYGGKQVIMARKRAIKNKNENKNRK